MCASCCPQASRELLRIEDIARHLRSQIDLQASIRSAETLRRLAAAETEVRRLKAEIAILRGETITVS